MNKLAYKEKKVMATHQPFNLSGFIDHIAQLHCIFLQYKYSHGKYDSVVYWHLLQIIGSYFDLV